MLIALITWRRIIMTARDHVAGHVRVVPVAVLVQLPIHAAHLAVQTVLRHAKLHAWALASDVLEPAVEAVRVRARVRVPAAALTIAVAIVVQIVGARVVQDVQKNNQLEVLYGFFKRCAG